MAEKLDYTARLYLDSTDVDEAIQKVEKLKALLQEVHGLTRSLAGNDRLNVTCDDFVIKLRRLLKENVSTF